MTISITHPFVSTKVDGTDPTVVQPSNWNESHVITMATGTLLGRSSAGVGPAQELDITQLPTMGTTGDLYVGTSGGYFRATATVGSWRTSGGTNVIQWNYSTGDFTATGNITAYSDAKLKTNVKTIDNGLELVKALRGVFFDKIDTGEAGVGVIAQELQKVLPQLVTDNDGTLSVAYGNIVGVLIEAIKTLSDKIDELERK